MKKFHVLMSILTVLSLAGALIQPARAAAPANDDFNQATIVHALPFSDSIDMTDATTSPDDPWHGCTNNMQQTVWYAFTPSESMIVELNTNGSNLYASLAAFTGSYPDNLNQIGCAYYWEGAMRLNLMAGETYYFMISVEYSFEFPLNLVFNLNQVPPPINDNFSNAWLIGSLPFYTEIDTGGANFEAGEPVPSCGSGTNLKTIWYRYTAPETGSLMATANFWMFPPLMAIYQGDSLANLTEIACSTHYIQNVFIAQAGSTYYFQLAGVNDTGGMLPFGLEVTPLPNASFYYYPAPPSSFDIINFWDSSWDPANIGFVSEEWDFGDGTTASGNYVRHNFAADGEYLVNLVVTTYDGRTASTSSTVLVETHDVAIFRFTVPQAAKAGQTRAILVDIINTRYDETVQVQIYKSVPGGEIWVGSLQMLVPAKSSNQTTRFQFSYTFTAEDALLGKVTFKAVASIPGRSDSLPTDNTAIGSPTKVSP